MNVQINNNSKLHGTSFLSLKYVYVYVCIYSSVYMCEYITCIQMHSEHRYLWLRCIAGKFICMLM